VLPESIQKKGTTTVSHKSNHPVAFLLLLAATSMPLRMGSVAAAELHAETIKAWNSCVGATERRIRSELSSRKGFLALDFQDSAEAAQERQEVLSGKIPIEKISNSDEDQKHIDVPDGMIHHWRGSVFIPGVSLDFVFSRIKNPNQEDTKQEDVLDSRILERAPGQLKLYLKLQRSKIVTVVYDTEHLVRYESYGTDKASSSSTATKIAEVERLADHTEREKPEGHDKGFLWRMNSYWRYQQVPGGVIVECESMTLSRSIPAIFELMVRPIINKIARESMQRTLESMRNRMVRAHGLYAEKRRP
jgi:hypothetical protein